MEKIVKLIKAALIAVVFLSVSPFIKAGAWPGIIAKANDSFNFDIYAAISKSEAGKNIFISPYSISAAFSMCYEGAAGETAAQMGKVFYFPADKETLRKGYLSLQAEINRKHEGYELSGANSIWPQKGYGFLNRYIDTVKKYYGGNAEEVDYAGNKEAAINMINEWAAINTKDKITSIVDDDSVNELTRMVLVNAVYFKGSWLEKFDKARTRKMDFHIPGRVAVKTDMMNTEREFNYGEFDGTKVIELPYAGGGISMIVALPDGNDTAKLEASLTYDIFMEWVNSLQKTKVVVALPKFKIGCLYSLNKELTVLGMPLAFDKRQADFSGMTGNKDLYITDAIHETYIDVNEEGTEAVAVTAIVMGYTSVAMPPEFIADHPFIFFIYDKTSGNILFMGRICNPTGAATK